MNKILKTLGLAEFITVKAPSAGWLTANAPNHQVDVILEASFDPKTHQGPVKVTAKAGGQSSVMGIYTFKQAMADALVKNLKGAGLM